MKHVWMMVGMMVLAGVVQAADVPVTFNQCKVCHTLGAGLPNKVGPNLWGVVGRKVATAPGFAYSPAMKAKGGSWDAKMLDAYLENPKAVVPGGKMAFAGVKDAAKRKELIAWLATQK